jgi:hypothetical protein
MDSTFGIHSDALGGLQGTPVRGSRSAQVEHRISFPCDDRIVSGRD